MASTADRIVDFGPSPRPPEPGMRNQIKDRFNKIARSRVGAAVIGAVAGAFAISAVVGGSGSGEKPALPVNGGSPSPVPEAPSKISGLLATATAIERSPVQLPSKVAESVGISPTIVVFPTETRVPTKTPIPTATPSPTPDLRPTVTPTPEMVVPVSRELHSNLSSLRMEYLMSQDPEYAVRNLPGELKGEIGFNLNAQDKKRLAPEVREITTSKGRIMEFSISQEFLTKAGTLSDFYIELWKDGDAAKYYGDPDRKGVVFGGAGNLIRLSASQLARTYNDENKQGDKGRVVFYVNEGGLGDEKYKALFGEKELLDNVIDVYPAFADSTTYILNVHFSDQSTNLVKNQGQIEFRPKTDSSYLQLEFER